MFSEKEPKKSPISNSIRGSANNSCLRVRSKKLQKLAKIAVFLSDL